MTNAAQSPQLFLDPNTSHALVIVWKGKNVQLHDYYLSITL